MGNAERLLRLVVGLVLLGSPLAWYGPENMSNWGFLGLVPLLTAVTGYCPLKAYLCDRAS